jgi:hypothetical protein
MSFRRKALGWHRSVPPPVIIRSPSSSPLPSPVQQRSWLQLQQVCVCVSVCVYVYMCVCLWINSNTLLCVYVYAAHSSQTGYRHCRHFCKNGGPVSGAIT